MALDVDKLAKKRQYKLRGVFLSYESITHYLGKVYVSKGSGATKKTFVFIVSGKLVADFMALPPKYRVKVWFTISCKQFKSNWFTELKIESFEHWAVNEAKIIAEAKQTSMLNDMLYAKKTSENSSFLS